MTRLCFVDVESTSLAPDAELWEVAAIVRDPANAILDEERTWQLPVDLGKADPAALSVGNFYARRNDMVMVLDGPNGFAAEFSKLTHDAHLVGAAVNFDAALLARTLRANGACPGWSHRLICVETLALGWLVAKGDPSIREEEGDCIVPRGLAKTAGLFGIDVNKYALHSALDDTRLARDVYDAVVAG